MIVSEETANQPARQFDPKLLQMMRRMIPNVIAEDIINVQPMDPMIYQRLMDAAMSEEDLLAEGYKPVSHHRLMWTKPA